MARLYLFRYNSVDDCYRRPVDNCVDSLWMNCGCLDRAGWTVPRPPSTSAPNGTERHRTASRCPQYEMRCPRNEMTSRRSRRSESLRVCRDARHTNICSITLNLTFNPRVFNFGVYILILSTTIFFINIGGSRLKTALNCLNI